ncbi:MAG: hypothetical protein ACREK4_20670 [Candidatus Rokuibacteriota bacterium]
MAAGPHVFEDGRIGCWIVSVSALDAGRLAALRRLGFTDLFLRGPDGNLVAKRAVLKAGFTGCHAWWAVDGLTAAQYAARALADVARWSPGAGDLNVELGSDAALEPYMRVAVGAIRAAKPNYRLRLNIATRKAGFLPIDLVQNDPNLYACEGAYFGNMDSRYSEADALDDLLAVGVERRKAAVCYAGAVAVGGITGTQRVAGIPQWLPRRGVVFQDDLLAEAGLL